jgi:two-component system response regulator NreC
MMTRHAPFVRPARHSNQDRTHRTTITRREEQVLKLVAWGLTHKQISAKLGISIKTVESHKAKAKTVFQLHDRADIVKLAVARGWFCQS